VDGTFGTERWLVVKGEPEDIWPPSVFWQELGFHSGGRRKPVMELTGRKTAPRYRMGWFEARFEILDIVFDCRERQVPHPAGTGEATTTEITSVIAMVSDGG
jgi:hypothetical protein